MLNLKRGGSNGVKFNIISAYIIQYADTTRSLRNRIRKRQANFFGHVIRREKLEHLLTTGMMKGKCSRGKQCDKMLDGLTKWFEVGRVTEALKAKRDRDVWKVIIFYAKEQGT